MMKTNLLNRMLGVAGAVAALALAGCGPSEPASKGVPVEMRRLTEDQYRSIIADVFGDTIAVAGRFDPLVRTDGLLAVGAHKVGITPSGFERFEGLARSIAAQVVDQKHRGLLVPCKPAAANAADDACAKQFYEKVGKLLYRRPLSAEELKIHVSIANASAASANDFYAGLARGLSGMLAAPEFLYVVDFTEPDPSKPGALRLDAFSKASRLSFLLWNTTPDDELLAAAERGDLHTKDGLNRQIDRMLSVPRLESGVRAFFSDMLGFEDFEALTKDGVIYPAFSSEVSADAKEQTLRTIVELLVTQEGDYRDLFTTRKTFMSGPLGLIYHVPVKTPEGGWTPFEFSEGDPRVGIQTQLSFVALHSHPGKSSPTLRGRALREVLLCQKVPDPPGNVNFDLFNDPNSPNRTARDRLKAHSVNPACAGCHKIMDPIGLTMETFDGAGQLRATEQGVPIDVSGEIDNVKFDGTLGLGKIMHDNPAVPSCLVNRAYAYATGRSPSNDSKELMQYLEQRFASDGYRFPELLRRIATSDAFFAVAPAAGPAPAQSAAGTSETAKEGKS